MQLFLLFWSHTFPDYHQIQLRFLSLENKSGSHQTFQLIASLSALKLYWIKNKLIAVFQAYTILFISSNFPSFPLYILTSPDSVFRVLLLFVFVFEPELMNQPHHKKSLLILRLLFPYSMTACITFIIAGVIYLYCTGNKPFSL